MTTFNEQTFIGEFNDYVRNLRIKSALEVGCQSGELLGVIKGMDKRDGIDINPVMDHVIQGDIREHEFDDKYELVFSSGLLGHFDEKNAIDVIQKMAAASDKYILNYVPNSDCVAYINYKKNTDAEWNDELDFTVHELVSLHEKAGLKVVDSGVAAKEWAKRFGNEPSEGYLVYVLAEKEAVKAKGKGKKK